MFFLDKVKPNWGNSTCLYREWINSWQYWSKSFRKKRKIWLL